MKLSPLQLLTSSIIIFIFQFSIIQSAEAQISITKSSIEQTFQGEYNVTSSLSEDSETILPLYEMVGPDQEWDFTTLEYDESFSSTGTIESSTNLSGYPLHDDSHFAQASHVFMSDFTTDTLSFTLYSYQILNDDEFILLGSVMIEEDETEPSFISYNRPGIVEFEFPATYESTWSFSYEQEMSFGESSQSTETDVSVEIEGWGKAITADGETDVLRIRKTETMSISGFEFSSFEIQFVAANGLEVANITGETDPFSGEVDEDYFSASVNTFSGETSTSEEVLSEIPTQLKLDQNYPNPFNPATQITYEISEQTRVLLQVYSITGEQVATLVNGSQPAGSYTIPFDASEFSSGIYLYRLTANNQTLTRKMTLIK